MRRRVLALSAAATLLLLACGGTVAGQNDGGGDASRDGLASDGSSGVTACAAPGDLKLCGGQCGQTCPVDKCASSGPMAPPMPEIGLCLSGPLGPKGLIDCSHCPDGHVCALPSARYQQPLPDGFVLFECVVPEVAQMYALNGRKDLALYADRSTYTDAPLPPPPETCPSFPGLRLCGGACGGCEPDEVCMGRSPLHPYSLCVRAKGECIRGNPGGVDMGIKYRCLTFKADDDAQPTADRWSVLAREEQCLAAAKYYPGGAFCGP